ncbi:MAG: 50S ribosomal protein L15 [Phycisphaeraceae bacterium]
MMIHEITKLVGRNKRRKRVGRGPGSGRGKTSGRGHKGAGSRSGYGGSMPPSYEGGQMPYFRRIPKRGFNNAAFRTEYAIVNVKALEERFDDGAEVNTETLVNVGLVRDAKVPVKILGEGEIGKKLTVTATRFSSSAREKIEKAGGTCTVA